MASVRRHSFTRLTTSEQNDEQFCLNIVFIHGLRGHPQRTWETTAGASHGSSDVTKKSKGPRSLLKRWTGRSSATDAESALVPANSASSRSLPAVFWPKEYLAVDIPQARVWTYGYNADVIGGLFQATNDNSISQHGRDLSVRLEQEIDNGKPLAFVAHSLGGIILKDAIRRLEMVRSRTKLVVFLGTPHRGSTYAGWGQIASNLASLVLQDSNKKILMTLEVNNEVLDNIHEEFKTIAFAGTMKIHSFQEAKGITGMKGASSKVVDDFSSKLDLPQALETVESIDANHMDMARYSSREDQGYRAISRVLKASVRQELERQQTRPAAVVDLEDVPSRNVLFLVPFARDNSFVGRQATISKISERKTAALTHTRMALVGLGGVGKSQIAIESAYRIKTAEPHVLVVWIHASNPIRFWQGYRDLADKLLLPRRENAKEDILQLVYDWLSDPRNGPWLMILDNVDEDSIFFGDYQDSTGIGAVQADHGRPLADYLPQAAHGRILITSRNKVAATNLVGRHGDVVQVEPMGEDEALELLRTRVPFSGSSQADAKALIHALEYIPLAITHAAAYIKTQAPITTISTYLKLFHESEANQVHLLSRKAWKDIRQDYSTRDAVITTWQITFKHLQKTKRSAADMLALMSMFDKQGIPGWLLQQATNTNQLDFNEALAPLLSFSLVRMEIEAQTLTMHRLVQLSMRSWLDAEKELDWWVKESIQVLSAVFPRGHYETWEQCKVLLPHLKEILGHRTEDELGLENQAESASRAGWYLLLMGEYAAAEGVLRLSLDIREKTLGREHPDTLISISQLGSVLESQGKYKEAEEMHRRALRGSEKLLGEEHPDTLTSISQLGSVLESQGKYKEAEEIQRRALRGREKVLGGEHPDTLTSVSKLGSVLERQGKYKEAEEMHRRDLAGSEKVLGPEHPDTLTSFNELGIVLERQGNFEEAEEMHRRALQGREKVLGAEHPDTLTSVSQLGSVLESQGKYEDAEAMYQRDLEGSKKVLGAEHPDTLTSMAQLASVFWNQDLWEKAERLERQVLKTRKMVQGEKHPDTLMAMHDLAFTLKSRYQWEEAISLMYRCYELRKEVLSHDHPYTKFTLETLEEWRAERAEVGA